MGSSHNGTCALDLKEDLYFDLELSIANIFLFFTVMYNVAEKDIGVKSSQVILLKEVTPVIL